MTLKAGHGYIYLRAEYPKAFIILSAAVEDARSRGLLGDDILGSGFSFDITVAGGKGSYVCGEETALINSIMGNRPEVSAKPPYPTEHGLFGRPTLVNKAMKITLGAGAATNSYDDIEKAGTILLCGANATENHPVIGARIKQRALAGATLIVIDPVKTELAGYADLHLANKPGTDIPLLNSMAHVIVKEGVYNESFARKRISNFSEYMKFISGRKWDPKSTAKITGVGSELVVPAALTYAVQRPSISIHGLGVTEHVQGTEGVMSLVNLALLTGNVGIEGGGVNPLRGQNNVQGSAHMGCEPNSLTGGISFADGMESFGRAWGIPLPKEKGMDMIEMIRAASDGKFNALWIIGWDICQTNANVSGTEKALKAMEFVVIQDIFMNETSKRFGHVFFPAASSFEKEGTFMNAERRINLVNKVVEPAGDSKPDWEIICDVAKAMGFSRRFSYRNAEDIWGEIRQVWPAAAGVTYERLRESGLQWPCPSEDHPGTEVLHGKSFAIGKRAALKLIDYLPTPETRTAEFPYLLTTGRSLYQFNAGTMTRRTRNIVLRSEDVLCIAPVDAARLSIKTGDTVRMKSRHGETRLSACVTDKVKPMELFATFHSP